MKTMSLAGAMMIALGCGHAPTTSVKRAESTMAPEAPVGALKGLAKGLESPNVAERKKTAEEIAKIGVAARPLQQAIKKAIEKETDEGAKAALGRAMEKTGGG